MPTINGEKHQQQQARRQQLLKGQFYTAPAICDLMLSLTVQNGSEKILEPGCGAGIFLCRAAIQLSSRFECPEASITEQLTGIELDENAIAQAHTQWQENGFSQPLKIHHADFLSEAMEQLNQFDIIIGNPPYVRQELLRQSTHMDKQAAQAYLQKKYASYTAQFPEHQKLFSQKTDLYLWFFLQAATLLKPGGTLAFITSNSWLNTDFGKSFRHFLTQQFDLLFLLESACERWFPDVAVTSLIVILKKKENNQSLQTQPFRIIRLHQPLKEWLPSPESQHYWQQVHEKAQVLLQSTVEEQTCTIRSISPALFAENKAHLNWTILMRAPQELLQLLQKTEKWIPLEQLGEVRYPLKTGINRFFYLSKTQAHQLKIEPRFLMPVVKSIRPLKHYQISSSDCDTFLFCCPVKEYELQENKFEGALKYIRWGEKQHSTPRQKRDKSIPWPQVPSVKNNRPWYAIKSLPPPHILCSRFYDRRFFFPICNGDLVEDQTFYGLTLAPEWNREFIAGLLNSTLTWTVMEFMGRSNLGEGVLQFSRGDMAGLPIPNPTVYSLSEQKQIVDCFHQLRQREVYPASEEVSLADREALDLAVIQPLLRKAGLSANAANFRNCLVNALLSRMQERYNTAKRSK